MAVKIDYFCDMCGDERSAFGDLVLCSKCEYWFCSYCISWAGEGAPWCPNCEGDWYGEDNWNVPVTCQVCGHPFLLLQEGKIVGCPYDSPDAPYRVYIEDLNA